MSSRETDNIAAAAAAKLKALDRLQRTEAAVFRFTHRVRAFLTAWPDDMPTPADVTPTFQDRQRSRDVGEWGDASYLHLTYLNRQDVEAWAARWDTDVVTDPGQDPSHGDHVTTECRIDGLRVLAACIVYPAEAAGGEG